MKSKENIKIMIFYRVGFEQYEPFSFKNNKDSLQLTNFFKLCYKIYLQEEKSIKNMISILYLNEREEYKAQQQRKNPEKNQQNNILNPILDKTAPVIKFLKNFSHDILHYRAIKLKENTQFFNLHTLLDSKELLNKNSSFLSIIESVASKKVRFSLVFLFAIVKQREKFERNILEIMPKEKEIRFLIEDTFQFLESYTINPLIFIDKSISFLLLLLNKNHNALIFSSLIKEYLMTSHEKQLILSIKNHKYELYKNIPNMTYEENISKIINAFPDEDHVELLCFHINVDFQYNNAKAHKIMTMTRKFDNLYNKSLKKEENLRDFIENKYSFKEFLLDPDNQYLKAQKKVVKLFDILAILDNDQSTNLKSNLYLNLLDIFDENLHFSSEFTDELLYEQPIITVNQIHAWLADDIRDSPTKSPNQFLAINRSESPSRFLKKSSIMFSPPTEKKSTQVKFEIPKKNSPVLYRSSSFLKVNLITNLNTRQEDFVKTALIPKKITASNSFRKMNNMTNDDSDYKRNSDTKLIDNALNEEVIKSLLLNEYLIMDNIRRVMKFDISSLLNNLIGKSGIILNERFKKIDKLINSNKTPIEWERYAFITEEDSLCEFCRTLLSKIEYLSEFLKEPHFIQNSIINLTKMFDPFAFFYYLILDYSLEKKVFYR